jgi:hypothetical protein
MICPSCRITIKKETADYVVVFAASQTYGSKRWSWVAYENKEGLLLGKGETTLFNVSIKDAAEVILHHFTGETLPEQPADSGAGFGFGSPEPTVIYVYRKEGGFKSSFNPSIQINNRDLVNKLTKDKYFALTIEPGRHVFTFKRTGTPPQQFIVDTLSGQETFIKYDSGNVFQPFPSMRFVERFEALKEMKKLKGEESKNIQDHEKVSVRRPES